MRAQHPTSRQEMPETGLTGRGSYGWGFRSGGIPPA